MTVVILEEQSYSQQSPIMIFDIFLTIFLVFLNGFFVAAEFAIVKVRGSQIELKARTGNVFAKLARSLITNMDAYLSATQLGITLASLGLGAVGEHVMSELVLKTLAYFEIQVAPITASQIAFIIGFSIITVLHIVLGELAPKSLAIQRSEAVTLAIAFPLRAFYFVFKPFIWLLNHLANFLLRLIGIEPAKEQELHSPEELRYLLEESQKSGAIEEEEHQLIENVFEFKETSVYQVMVPRTNIVGLELSMHSDELLDKVMDEGFSRMPVYQNTVDTIIGIVYTKDLLSMMRYQSLIILQDILRKPYYVSEDALISDVLRRMKKEKFHLAIVLDEFGGTAGIVTLEDIIEELVGEIQDEYDNEAQPVEEKNESGQDEYVVNTTTSITDLNEHLPLALPESEEYETLGGLLNSHAGRIPSVGEIFELNDYTVHILQANKRMIEMVKLIPKSKEISTEQDAD